ncbi:hypothetical protein L915_12829 [Phytophthora nicotianae]|uniref:Transcription activator GCR1-like domain-containing protein n=1 Tax=Phytophthora nicotianae TaxID=4792 RepID=W2N1L7_PHYNI|nr:hypothetical protein L915_12829 [Phytophthora nicotianae]ETL35094.1 hypothetical protein L916_12738 [Phytophthora nicotianae]ETM41584.1 hypothetical protein L914_12654 [Phytophthora nicotianae]
MSRGISTVKELWAEGHDGVADKPSIEYLETTYVSGVNPSVSYGVTVVYTDYNVITSPLLMPHSVCTIVYADYVRSRFPIGPNCKRLRAKSPLAP